MKMLVLNLVLSAFQINTLQDKPVVHLSPHQNYIPINFDGDLVELDNSPLTIQLPQLPSTQAPNAKPWSVDLSNKGPKTITIIGRAQFSVQVRVGQTVNIKYTKVGFVVGR